MNPGKRFENNFKGSVTEDIYFYRLRDGTASWDGGQNARFQQENDYDCILYDFPHMFCLELKSFDKTSIPVKNIKDNQVKGLTEAGRHNGIIAGFVFNIRKIERTFFVTIDKYNDFISSADRKSIPNDWIIANGTEISSKALKVNHRYDIKGFCKEMDNTGFVQG